ncbi:MAG TPA: hypothetical protein PL033_12120 [Candidatus Brocadiia bacterium]|nr:hypothetical protein [Candidatus Brocadiia bacterium]
MEKAHHALAVRDAAALVKRWAENPLEAPQGINVSAVADAIRDDNSARRLERLVKAADEIRDLRVSRGLTSAVMERFGNPTCFQHFAYCGSMGDLAGGGKVARMYDGYCWDCDPFMQWPGRIADLSQARIRHHPDSKPFDPEFLKWSPGARMVAGGEAWDDQKYPSAIDLAEFYGGGFFRYLSRGDRDKAFASLMFAVHMLQDLCVPHHVLGTVDLGHAAHERKALARWREIRRGLPRKTRRLTWSRLSLEAREMLDGDIGSATGFRELGEAAVRATALRLPAPDRAPSPTRAETWKMTRQAIACAIKAFDLIAAGLMPRQTLPA